MITKRPQHVSRILIGAAASAGMALSLAAAPAVHAAGIRDCVDVTGPVACYETVWSGGVEYRMTFSNQSFSGAAPQALDPFYVVGPQTGTPQGAPPNTFPHDHVVRSIPAQSHGAYSVRLQSFFVLCSGLGIVSGACVPSWTSLGGPSPLPFATSVNGRSLTSAGAIETAAAEGLVNAVNLGPDAVIVGTISGN